MNFKEIKLDNWDVPRVMANIDESEDQIIAAVLYNDHGDDFLVIKTEDDCFEYGWYVNRKGYPSYEDLERGVFNEFFLRNPEKAHDGKPGIAAKIRYDNYYIVGDKIEWIFYDNKLIEHCYEDYGIEVEETYDREWGEDTFELYMSQFIDLRNIPLATVEMIATKFKDI